MSMLPVYVVQRVQSMEDLRLGDSSPPEPLEEVDLLDGEARLLPLLEHSAKKSKMQDSCSFRDDFHWKVQIKCFFQMIKLDLDIL